MRKTICLSIAALGINAITPTLGSIVFDVNFESPTHVNGSAPTVGTGSDMVSGTSGIWTITNSFADSLSQVAAMDVLATGGGLGFSAGSNYFSGVHLISWDLAMLAPSSQSSIHFFAVNGPAQAVVIDYFGDGTVRIYDPNGSIENAATASLGSFHSFAVTFDLNSLSYDVLLDGNPVLENRAIQADTGIYGVSIFNPFGGTTLGVDNFRWEIVPEPSTIGLIGLGVVGLCGRWMAKRKSTRG